MRLKAALSNSGSAFASRVAMAIAAHPDDIEFQMAGTLLLLKQAGYETHYLNLSSGNCGSARLDPVQTRAIRRKEARQAAAILGAHFHPSLTDDLEIFYNDRTLRRLAAIIREVKPTILLIPSPEDYMEDHTNTCRLAVTAAFARGMPNYRTQPAQPATDRALTLYHAMPHGLCDGLGQRILPGAFVNTVSVHATKREALGSHQSQKSWLDVSQGIDSYLLALDAMSLGLGKISGRFKHAEGWRRHSHWGFCAAESDPLRSALQKNYLISRKYKWKLEIPR